MSRLAPSHRSSTVTLNSGSSVAATTPTGLVDGDYILIGLCVNDVPNEVSSPPSGFSVVVTKKDFGNTYLTVYGKVASGEGSTLTFTMANSNTAIAVAIAIKDADADAVDASGGQTNTGTNVEAPSISPTLANDLLVAFFATSDGSSVITPPGSMTERQQYTSNGRRIMAATEHLTASGATGTRIATITATKNNAGIVVAVRGRLLSSLLHKFATL